MGHLQLGLPFSQCEDPLLLVLSCLGLWLVRGLGLVVFFAAVLGQVHFDVCR